MNSDINIASNEFKECACACKGCKNIATTVLEVKYIQKIGHFCNSCAQDLLSCGLVLKKDVKLQSDQSFQKILSNNIANDCSNSLSNFFKGQKEEKLKLTPYRRSWVQQEVAKYAKQIGILEKDMPAIVCTRKEVLGMPKELTQGRRTVTQKCFGISFPRAKTIFINVKMHGCSQDVINTIVHELVHYRFRYLRHGNRFDQRIELILKGKKYPVKYLYPTTTQRSLEHDIQHLLTLPPTSREIASYEVADMHGISIDEIKKLIETASTKQ